MDPPVFLWYNTNEYFIQHIRDNPAVLKPATKRSGADMSECFSLPSALEPFNRSVWHINILHQPTLRPHRLFNIFNSVRPSDCFPFFRRALRLSAVLRKYIWPIIATMQGSFQYFLWCGGEVSIFSLVWWWGRGLVLLATLRRNAWTDFN